MLISIGTGALIGAVGSIIGNFFYLVLIFPVGMGLIGGSVLAESIKTTKIRKKYQAILLSVLMALTMYCVYHYGRYLALQIQTSILLFSDFSKAMEDDSLKAAKVLVDYVMKKETGYPGLVGYMLYKAKDGISIGRFYSNSRLNLEFIFTWFYWLFEFGISLWVLMRMGIQSASKLFCESCNDWYGKEEHLGGIPSNKEALLLNLINRKDFVGLSKLLEKNADLPSVEVYLQRCESCDKSGSFLAARRTVASSKGTLQFVDVLKTVLNPHHHSQLEMELGFRERLGDTKN